jgi:Xaa-Pro aminopeptidase
MTHRIKKAQERLKKEKLQALVIDQPLDLFYLTGLELSLGRLLITESDFALFVDGRYYESCLQHFPSNTYITHGYGKDSSFARFLNFNGKIGFDAHVTTYEQFVNLSRTIYGRKSLIPLFAPIKQIRQIKEAEEIVLLRQAAKLCSQGYDFLLSLFCEGISEEEAALELELFWRKKGGEKLSFSPIIAFGEGSSQPHYRAGEKRLKKNDIILMDLGVVYKKYHSDMTRVVSFGNIDPELAKIYKIIREAQHQSINLCAPGISIKEVSSAAREIIASFGYDKQFSHGLGHGVGLEIHEFPILKKIPSEKGQLLPGMVVTIEPGIYLPGKGGVRLEDTIVITECGYENLTQRTIPDEILLIA